MNGHGKVAQAIICSLIVIGCCGQRAPAASKQYDHREMLVALKNAFWYATTDFPQELASADGAMHLAKLRQLAKRPIEKASISYYEAIRFGSSAAVTALVASARQQLMGSELVTATPEALARIYSNRGLRSALRQIITLRLEGGPAETLKHVRGDVFLAAPQQVAIEVMLLAKRAKVNPAQFLKNSTSGRRLVEDIREALWDRTGELRKQLEKYAYRKDEVSTVIVELVRQISSVGVSGAG